MCFSGDWWRKEESLKTMTDIMLVVKTTCCPLNCLFSAELTQYALGMKTRAEFQAKASLLNQVTMFAMVRVESEGPITARVSKAAICFICSTVGRHAVSFTLES